MLLGQAQSAVSTAPSTPQMAGYYPEECGQSADCTSCVQTCAESVTSFVEGITPEGATRIFRKMYSHPACMLMEHSFVYSCCPSRASQAALPVEDLVNIASAA